MKLNMEIMYVPQANIYQLRDMMFDWRILSDRISLLSYIAAAFSLLAGLVLKSMGDGYYIINIGCALMFLVCAVFSKRWYYLGYVASFIAFLMNAARLSAFPIDNIVLSVILFVVNAVPMVFAFKCIYNYSSVFEELKKRKGFPDFIANTADLYADKIYLRTEREKGTQTQEQIYDDSVQAGYNPFKTDKELSEEEFARQQNATVKFLKETRIADIETDEQTKRKILLKEAKEKATADTSRYKYGQKVFGKELIFLHNDIHISNMDDKRSLMWKWNNNIDWTAKDFGIFAVVMAMAIMTTGLSESLLLRMARYLILIFFMMGTSYMKQGKFVGGVITGLTVLYTIVTANNILGFCFLLGAYIINPGVIFGTLRFLLNYKLYKELSKEEGFPTFIRNTASLYGDKIYIVEKQEPLVKKDPAKRKVKVMDIGVDEKPKEKDDRAWNAFDYKDGEKDGENNES